MPQAARIFVSHNSHDAEWCHTFVAALRQTEADVWYDEHDMGSGQLMEEIERELRLCPIFLVVLSPAAVASPWVRREVNAAIHLRDQSPQRVVLPIVAEHCAIPLFWEDFKRISGPDDSGVIPAEAARRVISILSLVPATAVTALTPLGASETKEEAVVRGNGLYAQKRYEEALAAYDRALTLDSRDAVVWYSKGATLEDLERYEEALISYNQAIALDSKFAGLTRFVEAMLPYEEVGPQDANNKTALLRQIGNLASMLREALQRDVPPKQQ